MKHFDFPYASPFGPSRGDRRSSHDCQPGGDHGRRHPFHSFHGLRRWLKHLHRQRLAAACAAGFGEGRHSPGEWSFPGQGGGYTDSGNDERGCEGGGRFMMRRGRHESFFGGTSGGFGGGRGPGRRPFEQGDLRWLVLDLIAAQPRHGYEIIKAIEEALDGHYSPSPGVIYPTLTLLEETGLISGESQGAKKLYSITEAGTQELAQNAEAVEGVRSRLAGARAAFGGVPAPEVMRAMGNLRSALQIRLSKGQLTPEAVRAIAAAIDRAAGEIEGI